MGDAEHTAEPTGNTLGMMMQLGYGNPTWIERSLKAGKLSRDLWIDYKIKIIGTFGREHPQSHAGRRARLDERFLDQLSGGESSDCCVQLQR